MGLKDIERSLVGYYGKHQSEHVQNTSIRYIESTYTTQSYKTLLQEIMKTHPFNYGFPDVSAIEKASEYYYLKNDKKSLKKVKDSANEFVYQYKPLTDEEREEAEPEHEKFMKVMGEIVNNKTDKEEKKYCKDCTHFMKGKDNYECKGCIDHKKFESKQELEDMKR